LENRAETPAAHDSSASRRSGVSVARISYHGWPDCYLIANGSVEAVVVPAIGRVMQLRLKGEAEGAFWANRALDGQLHNAASSEWMNFGGDKCWPAPQSAWPQHQGRDWPPPVAFDALPVAAVVVERGVVLTSSIDSGYGIQTVRRVELDPAQPIMRIATEFRKLSGAPVTVGIWTITQMSDPARVCIQLHAQSKLASGYVRMLEAEPADLKIDGRLLSLTRHARQQVKVGSDGSSLAWLGKNCVVRIDTEIGPGEYPDGGCVTEVYTNPDPLQYVELETLGPLTTMNPGDRIEQTTAYTMRPRSTTDLEAEARNAFR
jgi:hypothetical protein